MLLGGVLQTIIYSQQYIYKEDGLFPPYLFDERKEHYCLTKHPQQCDFYTPCVSDGNSVYLFKELTYHFLVLFEGSL